MKAIRSFTTVDSFQGIHSSNALKCVTHVAVQFCHLCTRSAPPGSGTGSGSGSGSDAREVASTLRQAQRGAGTLTELPSATGAGAPPGAGSGSGSGGALAPTSGTGGLIGILKGLEIEKSLATDPVVVALRYFAATTGSFAPLPPDLSPKLTEYLKGRGLDQLYTHQRAAYDLAKAGKSFVVTTPTASGKTLC
jgi:hypothetical protein